MSRAFREAHEARLASDPQYAVEYARLADEGATKLNAALRNARISLAMWSMATPDIDALIGPMSEDERVQARRGRGGPLWDDGGEVTQSTQSTQSNHQ